jgi:hypothetical protein
MKFAKPLLILILACLLGQKLSYSAAFEVPHTPRQWGIWFAGSDSTPAILARVQRKFGIAAIQISESILEVRPLRLEYTCDFIPVLIVHQPSESRVGYFGPGALDTIHQPAKSIWGMGVAPVGLRLNVAPTRAVFPYFAVSTGAAYTTEKIPFQVPGGTNLNFLFQLGGGVRWRISPHQDLLFGFSWWHMSNGRLAAVNPGMDANLWSLTYLFS